MFGGSDCYAAKMVVMGLLKAVAKSDDPFGMTCNSISYINGEEIDINGGMQID